MEIIAKNDKDTTGKLYWYYRFLDNNRQNFNSNMSWLGRVTKKGIKSELSPDKLYAFFQYLISQGKNFDVSGKMKSAQKDIDNCNNKCGCNSYCSMATRSKCTKIKKHAIAMEIDNNIQEILTITPDRYTIIGDYTDIRHLRIRKLIK